MSSRERIQKALDSLLYLPHLQAQHSDEPSLPVAVGPGGAAAGAGGGKGRPWDRGDLFRRLATFRSSTWFCKPAVISPVECARRGWTNTAADLLSCEVRSSCQGAGRASCSRDAATRGLCKPGHGPPVPPPCPLACSSARPRSAAPSPPTSCRSRLLRQGSGTSPSSASRTMPPAPGARDPPPSPCCSSRR